MILPIKCKSNVKKAPKKNLNSLPNEILEHILSMCAPTEQNCFRNVCHRFNKVHRNFVVHNYNVLCKQIRMKTSLQRRNTIAILLRELFDMNKVFLQVIDLQVSFLSGVTELFKSIHSAVLSSDLIKMLNDFYTMAESELPMPSFNVSFLATLLCLLNQFTCASKWSERIGSTRIHIKYVIHGIWFIFIWSSGIRFLNHPTESRAIVIMLTILLINEKFHRTFYEINNFGPRTLVYGNAIPSTSRIADCVTFEIDIAGDDSTIEYFATNQIWTNASHTRNPLADENLTAVNIKLRCKEATRLGDANQYLIRF